KKLHLLSGITRHDILNKIMVIDGFLGFAEEIATDPTQAEYLGHVRAAAMVIQNILVFNRQYEQLGIEKPSWFAIDTLIEGIETEERLPLNSACESYSIYCDPMLEKVFYNLYDNALRHAEGATRIEIACRPSSSGLRIVWEDNGTGVPEDEKEEIFKRGFGKNTGMGLFLVREILAITGITITETGEEGKGARFEISVPEGAYRIGNPA
ncbi:HAMP domain-containing sensor histidine kinase, partial [Methanocalculus sp.]|uniref:sensor histidine kinase n=1 Tax=Methanocalculus sp. TaxID=2004547 RepID=UPI0026131A40